MKQNDIINENIDTTLKKLTPQNLENLWNIHTTDEGEYFYNLLKTVNFPSDLDTDTYGEYVTEPSDTWPLIAWKHYEDVKLWWIICMLNNIQDPTLQPEPSTTIKILSVNVVRDILTEIRSS